MNLFCFKAYDIRGRYPSDLDEPLARGLGFAFAQEFQPERVVIGHDARLSGPALYEALAEGLRAAGVDVTGIGLCGTEEIYYAAFARDFDGGIMVTGSHNPADENGFKLVRRGAVPVSSDSGLFAMRRRIAAGQSIPAELLGSFAEANYRNGYIEYLLSYIKPESLRRLRIVADPGNGCAGLVLQKLTERLPVELHIIHGEPDGTFPNGVPNPLLPEKRALTAQAVREARADFGIAWDGDFDRCFFYDAEGRFIEGYYLVGMIAEALLRRHPGAKIIHDPRLVWNTRDVVAKAGGTALESRTGHAFIKERMRAEDALYGGEMSAHHYFHDFAYCDSGMIPWLLVAQLLSDSGRTLADCVEDRMAAFPCSGEINSHVEDIRAVLARLEAKYAALPDAEVTHTDGVSVAFPNWRFNLRSSNTEPILRLNVESRGDKALMEAKTEELLNEIRG
ncbi:phosphomannomutase [uncultured Mailhella sp.]|uniref:phosphomannomutase n=1 Tax=uncultured Mailhella sp. TaxID=1981031 RepID=UPI0026337675|nr:phosphomannomutase [uncultured Mailhella sp.]